MDIKRKPARKPTNERPVAAILVIADVETAVVDSLMLDLRNGVGELEKLVEEFKRGETRSQEESAARPSQTDASTG